MVNVGAALCVNYGMIATGNHDDFGFAARSTTARNGTQAVPYNP